MSPERANTEAESGLGKFLFKAWYIDDAYKAALSAAGFTVVKERNRRDAALQAMQRRIEQTAQPIGLPVVMGPTAPQKLANMRDMIERGVFAPIELIARAD